MTIEWLEEELAKTLKELKDLKDFLVELNDKERIDVLCDCRENHIGFEFNNGNQLKWFCPMDLELKQDVNA